MMSLTVLRPCADELLLVGFQGDVENFGNVGFRLICGGAGGEKNKDDGGDDEDVPFQSIVCPWPLLLNRHVITQMSSHGTLDGPMNEMFSVAEPRDDEGKVEESP